MNSLSDNGGTWVAINGASSIALDTDVFKVSTGAVNAKLDGGASGNKGGMAITRGTPIDFDDAGARKGMIAFWALTTSVLRNTAITGGITIRVGSDVSNYFEWQLATLISPFVHKIKGCPECQKFYIPIRSTKSFCGVRCQNRVAKRKQKARK